MSRRTALGVGLKVDVRALPPSLQRAVATGTLDLDDPANTVALLRLKAVAGVTGFFDDRQRLKSIGIQCALCRRRPIAGGQ